MEDALVLSHLRNPVSDEALQSLRSDWMQPTVLATYNPNVERDVKKGPREPQPIPQTPPTTRQDVGSRLISYQEVYGNRVVEKRVAREQEVLNEAHGVPVINAKSRSLTSGRSSSGCFDRLATPKRAVAQRVHCDDDAAHSYQPEINCRSKALSRTAVNRYEWNSQRLQKVQKIRNAKEESAATVVTTPRLNPRSRQLAQGRAVEDLYSCPQTRAEHTDAVREKVADEKRVDAACDRLFTDAVARKQQQSEKERENELLSLFDEKGVQLFQPNGVGSGGYTMGRLGELATPRAAKSTTEAATFSPRIGTYSRLLADINDGGCVAHERLAKPKQVHVDVTPDAFAPELNQKSVQLDRERLRRTGKSTQRADELMERREHYAAHVERLRKEKRTAEEAVGEAQRKSNTSFLAKEFCERQERWAARREQRLRHSRDDQEEVAPNQKH